MSPAAVSPVIRKPRASPPTGEIWWFEEKTST
jgi:hypothetical protein